MRIDGVLNKEWQQRQKMAMTVYNNEDRVYACKKHYRGVLI